MIIVHKLMCLPQFESNKIDNFTIVLAFYTSFNHLDLDSRLN